jgi:tripartite-type tricarboxylate transporter receptor subunit TctC
MKRRDLLALGLASISAHALAPVQAFTQSSYPDRPIKLLVPFVPGGVVDALGRLWTEKVKAHLGSVYVENQGGAGGVIGAQEVARAATDGYTLLLGNTSTQVLTPAGMAKPPYDAVRDFAPISIIAITATSLVVHPSVPAKTLKELIDYARASPGKLSYGSAGAGTLTNLTGEMFKHLIGVNDIVHVPYKGAGPGIADLVSGHIPLMTPNVTGQLLELHRVGKVRILVVTSPTRLKGAPDIPTAVESGLPDMVAQLFIGLFAPAGTPKLIIDRIAQATTAVMADKDFQSTLVKSGFEPVVDSDPEKARQFISGEAIRWPPILKAAGMTPR